MGTAFDLEERTSLFGENVIRFAKGIRHDTVNRPLVSQLVRSATSIGANYTEADEASSRKEFRYRITVCRKEAKETLYWLRMIAAAEPTLAQDARTHWKEAKELHLIFCRIVRTTELNNSQHDKPEADPHAQPA